MDINSFEAVKGYILIPGTNSNPPSIKEGNILIMGDAGYTPITIIASGSEEYLRFKRVDFCRTQDMAIAWLKNSRDEWEMQDLPFKKKEPVKYTQPQRRVGGGGILDMLSKLLPFAR